MKILFFTIGNDTVASSRARVYGYIPYLEKNGIKCKIVHFTSAQKCRRILLIKNDNILQRVFELFYKIYAIARVLALSASYDVVFMQKVTLPGSLFGILVGINKKVVFDFDDAIYMRKDISQTLKRAAGVIVSNRELKNFAAKYNTNVYELISPVEIDEAARPTRQGAITVGWLGSPETSAYLEHLEGVFKRLKEKFNNMNIMFMGAARNKNFTEMGIRNIEWSMEGEREFLKNLDIGIMPLPDDKWSRAKAGYKLLLYMSRRVACVASPVGINTEIIKDDVNGYLADSPDEWTEKLSRLIKDEGLRFRLASAGRTLVEKYYSYKVCAGRLTGILNGIYSKIPQ